MNAKHLSTVDILRYPNHPDQMRVRIKLTMQTTERYLLKNVYRDTNGEIADYYDDDDTILITPDNAGDTILQAIKDNIASYINIEPDGDEIRHWISTEPEQDDPLYIANTPYLQCAVSDNFEGSVDIYIHRQTFAEYLTTQANIFASKINQFHKPTN